MSYGSINVDTITGSGASSVIVNNGTNNVAGFTTGNNIQLLQNGGGIVFSNSSASTNSTLNDYETGTWTVTDQSGAGLTFTNATGQYTKIGNLVYYSLDINFPSTSSTANVLLSLPFTSFNTGGSLSPGGAYQTYNPAGTYTWYTGSSQAYVRPYTNAGVAVTNITFSGKEIAITGVYKASF